MKLGFLAVDRYTVKQGAGLWPAPCFCYHERMKIVLIVLGFLLPGTVAAFSLQVVEPAQQYEPMIVSVQDLNQHQFLGQLTGDPETFQFTNETVTKYSIQVSQRNLAPKSFSLIVIRLEGSGRGVSEITRSSSILQDWESERNALFGMQMLHSQPLELTLVPGTYQIEISTPENQGSYMLSFADGHDRDGYFATLRSIWDVQKHFGMEWYRYFSSVFVAIPLGIALILLGWYMHGRDKKKHNVS